ncbi:hypothetical protein EGW08_008406 [Elysia chlorotica]|uniref:Uncharacterized protein n=1 Tax=Elysia chlorotica TaxID=188477 RepID=A0A3S1BLT6_ELYCH|nr:hypothetical protein EGW08_008406 [Elysia chlorotica]
MVMWVPCVKHPATPRSPNEIATCWTSSRCSSGVDKVRCPALNFYELQSPGDQPPGDIPAISDSIEHMSGEHFPDGLRDCLPYLLCSQHAIKVIRETSALISRLELRAVLAEGKLADLCHNVKVMVECETYHWKEACANEIGSKGRKSETKFMEWICNKRERMERHSACWAHPGLSNRLTDCVTEYTDLDDITHCFEQELQVEDVCSDGAIAFLQTMAVKYMKPS